MQVIFRTALALGLANLAAGQTTPPPDLSQQRLTPPEAQFIMIVAARFYCDRGRWPTTIAEMFEYRETAKLYPNISVRTALILRADISYSYQPTFWVRAPTLSNDKPLSIEMSQDPPKCNNGNVKLQGAKMHLDFTHPS